MRKEIRSCGKFTARDNFDTRAYVHTLVRKLKDTHTPCYIHTYIHTYIQVGSPTKCIFNNATVTTISHRSGSCIPFVGCEIAGFHSVRGKVINPYSSTPTTHCGIASYMQHYEQTYLSVFNFAQFFLKPAHFNPVLKQPFCKTDFRDVFLESFLRFLLSLDLSSHAHKEKALIECHVWMCE